VDDLDLLLKTATPHQPQRWEWFRFDPDLVVDYATLPTPIFDLLAGGGTSRVSRSYASPALALEALKRAVKRYRTNKCNLPEPEGFEEVTARLRAPVIKRSCPECHDSGYAVHPENGWVKGVRCSRGCRVQCSICNDPNCDNPGGQH